MPKDLLKRILVYSSDTH